MKIALSTGGFDPVHGGHLKYLKASSLIGSKLIVGVNSDDWLIRKKGKPFMPWSERSNIISELKYVDGVIPFNDSDGTAIGAIKKLLDLYPNDEIVFCNGGDRNISNIPEAEVYGNHSRVKFEWSVGGDNKDNSSSWILEEWKAPKVKRIWGYYRVLHDPSHTTKVKELVVDPGKKLSMQRHFERSEHWFIDTGIATLYTLDENRNTILYDNYTKHQNLHIPTGMWHMLSNETEQVLKLIEIQYGTNCIEDDIERVPYETN